MVLGLQQRFEIGRQPARAAARVAESTFCSSERSAAALTCDPSWAKASAAAFRAASSSAVGAWNSPSSPAGRRMRRVGGSSTSSELREDVAHRVAHPLGRAPADADPLSHLVEGQAFRECWPVAAPAPAAAPPFMSHPTYVRFWRIAASQPESSKPATEISDGYPVLPPPLRSTPGRSSSAAQYRAPLPSPAPSSTPSCASTDEGTGPRVRRTLLRSAPSGCATPR